MCLCLCLCVQIRLFRCALRARICVCGGVGANMHARACVTMVQNEFEMRTAVTMQPVSQNVSVYCLCIISGDMEMTH